MKNLIVALIILTSSGLLNAQGMYKRHEHMREKFKQLEKLKLLEILQLNEETAVRFFSRRNKFLNEQKEILRKRKELIAEAERLLEEKKNNYNSIIEGIKKIEKELLEKRTEFFDSVKDILTPKQIVEMIIFDYRFKQEIRNVLMKRGKKKIIKE